MVSWWVRYLYFNNEAIQISDVVFMNAEYGSLVSFRSINRSKFIGHNTYTGKRENFRSEPTPIHGPVNKF